MKKFAILVCLLSSIISRPSVAQTFRAEYTTELQTNFKASNWINLLRLKASLSLGKHFHLEVSSLSTAETHDDRLAQDLQVFSNIEAGNLPFALAVANVEWQYKGSTLSVGIRNMNEDYFTTPVTSLFTNSSCGIFPTIAANAPIANYPLASVGINYTLQTGNWSLSASLYNGQGYSRFTGKENVFRFCPQSDGIFTLASADYQHRGSHYIAGASLHHGRHLLPASDTRTSPLSRTRNIGTVWSYVEQRISPSVDLLLQYSACLSPQVECRTYAGIGAVIHIGSTELGFLTNYADFSSRKEEESELTWKIPCFKNGYLQPTFYFIHSGHPNYVLGMVRAGYSF